jgi:hypothetical protein
MSKLYDVIIQNIITETDYKIKTLGSNCQEVHKHVLYKILSRNEIILSIEIDQVELFDNNVGFYFEE